MVMAPFSYGLATTLIPSEPLLTDTEVVAPSLPSKPEYYAYGLPISVTLPKFDRIVGVHVSFMIDEDNPLATELWDALNEYDGRMDTILANAIIQAGETASSVDDVRDFIPGMIRHEINVQIGTNDNPTPVREVLLTSYAIQ